MCTGAELLLGAQIAGIGAKAGSDIYGATRKPKTPIQAVPQKVPVQQAANPLADFFQQMQRRPSATPPFNPSPDAFGGGGGYPGSVYDVF